MPNEQIKSNQIEYHMNLAATGVIFVCKQWQVQQRTLCHKVNKNNQDYNKNKYKGTTTKTGKKEKFRQHSAASSIRKMWRTRMKHL